MNHEFAILAGFLDKHFADDVEGRSVEEMPPEIQSQFKAFARGELEDADRARLSQLLKENPQWISALAEEARTPRGAPKGR